MEKLKKTITNGRMLKNTGSWMYCNKCDKTVGYLCYSTYQSFRFEFLCNCGNSGTFDLAYESDEKIIKSEIPLKIMKNRLCCPNDDAPLFSIVKKHIKHYSYSIVCNKCHNIYKSNICANSM